MNDRQIEQFRMFVNKVDVVIAFDKGRLFQDVDEETDIGLDATDTEFTEEDPYDYDGLVITAYFEDGSSRIITDACTYDPAPGTPAVYGTDTVNVTYAPSAASSATTSSSDLPFFTSSVM